MESEKRYENGKLYQWTGSEFAELEPSTDAKVSVSVEAMESIKTVRKAAHQLIRLRPELSLVASAMLLAAAELPDIAVRVKTFGLHVYGGLMEPMIAVTAETEVKEKASVTEPQGEVGLDKVKTAVSYLD